MKYPLTGDYIHTFMSLDFATKQMSSEGQMDQKTQIDVRRLATENVAQYSIFKTTDLGICLIEPLPANIGQPLDFCFISMNQAFQAMFGVPDLSGQSVRKNFLSESEDWYQDFERVLITGKPLHVERPSAPQNKFLDCQIVSLLDNPFPCLMLSFTDITKRKAAEAALLESEFQYRELWDKSRDALVLCYPPDYKLSQANPAAVKLFGTADAAQLASLSPYDLSPEFQLDGARSEVLVKQYIAQAMASGSAFYEWTHKRLDGSLFPCSVLLSKTSINGQTGVQATVRDISRRKGIENKLRLATQAVQLGIWVYDITSNQLSWDDTMYALYGTTSKEFEGAYAAWENRLHPDDRARAAEELATAIAGGKAFDTEFRVCWPDGSVHYHKANAVVEQDANGQPLRMVGTNVDVTSIHQASESLRLNEARYRALFENMSERVHLWQLVRDRQGQIQTWRLLDINPAALAGWGKTPQEVIGKTGDEIFPGMVERYTTIVQKIFEEHSPHSWESYIPERDEHLRFTLAPFDDCFISTGTDVTEYKRMQEQLSETNQLLELALAGSDLGVWDSDLVNEVNAFNDRFCEILGLRQDEIDTSFEGWKQWVHPDDLAELQKIIDVHQSGGTRSFEARYRLKHKLGHWVWVVARGRAVRNAAGQVERITGTMADISERERMMQEGSELFHKFESLVSQFGTSSASADASASLRPKARLSPRNLEVLALIAQGLTANEIGERLHIAYETVVTHRQTIMRKLNLRNKAELIRYAVEHRIGTP